MLEFGNTNNYVQKRLNGKQRIDIGYDTGHCFFKVSPKVKLSDAELKKLYSNLSKYEFYW